MARRSWHNGGDLEMALYARSLAEAAAALQTRWKRKTVTPAGDWDQGPLVVLYRHALELRLKELVDAGNPFLPAPIDAITLQQTRSLRWLAQIVCQIIRAVEWEDEFVCDGVTNLKEFSALIAEADALEPVTAIIGRSSRPERATVLEFARKTAALLLLLDTTADGLAATWMLQDEQHTVH